MTRCCRDCRGALEICRMHACPCHTDTRVGIEDKSRLTAYRDDTGNTAAANADRSRRAQ